MATLGSMNLLVGADISAFTRNITRAEQMSAQFSRNLTAHNAALQRGYDAVSTSVKAAAASLGAMVTVAGAVRLGSLAKDALDAAGNLGEMATAAGVTTRQLQQLQVAGVQVGLSAEETVRALAQFGVRVGEAQQGTGELVDTLERYGIATANSSGQVRGSIDIALVCLDLGVARPFEVQRVCQTSSDPGPEGRSSVRIRYEQSIWRSHRPG
jgi:hypothetical protein